MMIIIMAHRVRLSIEGLLLSLFKEPMKPSKIIDKATSTIITKHSICETRTGIIVDTLFPIVCLVNDFYKRHVSVTGITARN